MRTINPGNSHCIPEGEIDARQALGNKTGHPASLDRTAKTKEEKQATFEHQRKIVLGLVKET